MCQKLIIESDILAFLEKEEGLALGPPVSVLLARATLFYSPKHLNTWIV